MKSICEKIIFIVGKKSKKDCTVMAQSFLIRFYLSSKLHPQQPPQDFFAELQPPLSGQPMHFLPLFLAL